MMVDYMENNKLENITTILKERYPDLGIKSIEVDEKTGQSTFYLTPNNRVLAGLPSDKVGHLRFDKASMIKRDTISRSSLDLIKTSPSNKDPKELYKDAIKYYYEFDVYGAHIDILSNFASKGFENDIDDPEIKLFYDVWNFDVGFHEVLDWIFFDLFRVGMVRTYKIIGKYEPGVSYLSNIPGKKKERALLKEFGEKAERVRQQKLRIINKRLKELDGRKLEDRFIKYELSAKKKIWSKGYMPIAYTILNPLLVTLEGSLLFNKSKVILDASDELKKLLQKPASELTDDEKLILKLLPTDFKKQAEKGKIELDPLFVGEIDYRKQPYELYSKPRGIKAFESLEYKKALREADLSTLDGISNYILKITVGNDEYPCTDQSQLEAVAQLFNTPSKSFDVVWNHTLKIEKIVSPEIESILGQDKYAQVNEDITGAIAMSRALIDGTQNVNTAEAGLIVKAVIEEINYARRLVERWIYKEYRQIAEAMGFDRFPRVRWDNTILRDIILYMSTISQLVDRRMLSYRTALEELGFDFPTESANMEDELPMVLDGIFGIIGSPFQQAKMGVGPLVQPKQGEPTGAPSAGRPKGKVAKPKSKNTKPKAKVPNQAPSQQPAPQSQTANVYDVLTILKSNLNEEQFNAVLEGFFSKSYR